MPKRRIALIALAGVLALIATHWLWGRTPVDNGVITLYGNVDISEVELAFRQPGRLEKVMFDEGASVKKGDLLAELEATPYEDAVMAATANKVQAEAELEKVRRGARAQEIAQAEEAVRQAEAVKVEADRTLSRQTALAATGAVSDQALDSARSASEQAQARLASARQALSLRLEGSRKEDVAAAEARLAVTEAQLAQAQTALADTHLLAPSNGVIFSRVREAGSMVTSGTPVYTLSIVDPVYVRAYASEPQLTKIHPGSVVTVRADGSAAPLQGTVGFISPRAEFTPKSVETTELRTDLVYRVRIVVPDAARRLRQGMPVTVEIDASTTS